MRWVAVVLVAVCAGFGAGYAVGDNNHPAHHPKAVTCTDPNPFNC